MRLMNVLLVTHDYADILILSILSQARPYDAHLELVLQSDLR